MNNRQTQIFCSVGAIALLGGCSAFQPQAKLEIRSVESVQHSASKSDALAEGRALLKLGQNANAISAFRAALRDQPENGDAYNGLAIAYDRIGRKDLAQRYFELALSFDPENPRFRANLARLFNRSGQPQLAADLVEQPASAEKAMADVARPLPTQDSPLQRDMEFVATLPTEEPLQTPTVAVLEPPALAAIAFESPVTEIAKTQPTLSLEPERQAITATTTIHAVYRPKAAMAIRPASIEPSQLPRPAIPASPDKPLERQPADLPRQVLAAVQREGIRLERISLGEVRLVTRPTTPKAMAKDGNFDSFGARLASWLPGAIAVEQAGRTAPVIASPSLKEAIARAQIETAIEDVEDKAEAEAETFSYAFFNGDDVSKVTLAAL